LCFHDRDRKLLLSGDHVLPTIGANISAHPQQSINPLGEFLVSLSRVRGLEVEEVLPAHQFRFEGLAQRTLELARHHAERLEEFAGLVRANPGATGWDLTTLATWSRPWEDIRHFMRRAALGETLAHLHLLEERGLVH